MNQTSSPDSSNSDIASLQQNLLNRRTSVSEVLAQCGAIAASDLCRHVYRPDYAPGTRRAYDDQEGGPALRLDGVAVSIKDLFDVAGQTTSAGSIVLADSAASTTDCLAVLRLRRAGAFLAGRTNMVEFAFSGVGINPHFGTPVNPADPQIERIPGGSSSGAAVSVGTGAALAALGSDTGGSLRIPAALCGVVGFKSTARLVPTSGALPLSTSLDTVGALTNSVSDAITLHEVLADREVRLAGKPLAAYKLAVLRNHMQDSLDASVAQAFEHSLRVLRDAGAAIETLDLTEIDELADINATGGFSAAESYAWHRHLITQREADYDPRVAVRILRGARMTAFEYIELLAARRCWIAKMEQRLSAFDAVVSPTVPIVAPPIASVVNDDTEFFRVNGLLLRNTAVVNMLDGCAISIPCQRPGQLPVGLMLWHAALHDDCILDLALQVEAALAASHRG